jgi:hypothetical protein
MIKAYLKGQQREWDKHLGCLAATYRATPHEVTGMTPNLVMMGRETRLPAEVKLGTGKTDSADVVATYGKYVSQLRDRMQHAHEIARQKLQAGAKHQKETYDAKISFHRYVPGDLVWYASQLNQLHLAPKLRNPYEGPFVIVKRINDINYRIQFNARAVQRVVHHNKLKPYHGSQTLSWAKAAVKKAQKC